MLASLSPDLLRTWLGADHTRVTRLAELVCDADNGIQATVSGRERETMETLVELLGHDRAWAVLTEAGADLPAVLAYRRVWQDRRAQCDEFERQLHAGEWLEGDWQRFFVANTWIFGYGLRYQFLHLIQDQPLTGGQSYTR